MFVFCLVWPELVLKPRYFPSLGIQKLFRRVLGIQWLTRSLRRSRYCRLEFTRQVLSKDGKNHYPQGGEIGSRAGAGKKIAALKVTRAERCL